MTEPKDILHDTGQNRIVITWDDGAVSELEASYLRAWCKCAECQGHQPIVRHQPVALVTMTRIEEIGAYALGIHFSDGHSGGIYSWDWLRAISAEGRPPRLKFGRYEAGRFVD